MDLQTILNIIGAGTQLVTGLSSLVNNATDVFSEGDADKVRAAAQQLKDANDRLTQVVLAKLG